MINKNFLCSKITRKNDRIYLVSNTQKSNSEKKKFIMVILIFYAGTCNEKPHARLDFILFFCVSFPQIAGADKIILFYVRK